MQHKAVYLLFCKFTLHVSGVNHTHRQEYTKLQIQPPVLCSYLPLSGQAWPRWREVAGQKIWPVPEAVVTVLCTPDDVCGWYPKHVEWTCRIINRLLCVASRWTIINNRNQFYFTNSTWWDFYCLLFLCYWFFMVLVAFLTFFGVSGFGIFSYLLG